MKFNTFPYRNTVFEPTEFAGTTSSFKHTLHENLGASLWWSIAEMFHMQGLAWASGVRMTYRDQDM